MDGAIIVPADREEVADRALPWAESIAARTGAQVYELRCVERATRVQAPVAHKVIQVEGRVGESIVAAATVEAASLIVMPTHGRSGVDYWIHGSVAESVVREASCPVLVLPPQVPDTCIVKRVVVAIDSTPLSERPLWLARCYGEVFSAPVALVTAVNAGLPVAPDAYAGPLTYDDILSDLETAAENRLKALARPAEAIFVLDGLAATALESFLEEGDLLVLATHSRPRSRRLFVGSVAGALMAFGRNPMLIVNPYLELPERREHPRRNREALVHQAAVGDEQAVAVLLNALPFDDQTFRAIQTEASPLMWTALLRFLDTRHWTADEGDFKPQLLDEAATEQTIKLLYLTQAAPLIEAVKSQALVQAMQGPREELAALAVRLAGERLPGTPEAMEGLAEGLASAQRRSERVRIETARAAAGLPRNAALPLLARALGDPMATVRAEAEIRLVELGAQSELLSALQHGPDAARMNAVHGLRRLGCREAAPALANVLTEQDADLVWAAGDALIAIGVPAVPPVLNAIVRTPGSRPFYDAARRTLRHLQTVETQRALHAVLEALASSTARETAPTAAEAALRLLAPRMA